MEKLSLLLIFLGISLVECCDNIRHDNLVFFNSSPERLEGESTTGRTEKQIADFLADFSLLNEHSFDSLPDNSECRIHMKGVFQQAAILDLWALKLLDASAKLPPSGILNGNLNQFGDFDECLTSKGHFQTKVIQGKYCLVSVGIKVNKNETNKLVKTLDAAVHSHWLLHNGFRDQGHRIPKFETFNLGVCIPASCRPEEIEAAFSDRLQKLFSNHRVNFEVSVDDDVCYLEKEERFSAVALITGCVYLLLIGLIILSTFMEIKEINIHDLKLKKTLLCFSLKRNLSLLLNVDPPKNDIKCLHGARFLNAVALLLSHKQIAMLFNPVINRTQMSEIFSKSWTMIGRAAILYTDSFILFSGLLVSYSLVKDLDLKKRINFRQKLINRVVRLMPNLFGVIFFCTYIMDGNGSGPQWGLVVTKYTNLCKKYMWRNFLFVHNYFGFENMCLTHTHQLGIDMQLFLVSPIFIYFLWKTPRTGGVLLVLLSAVSTWLRYEITYKQRLSTLLYYGISVEQLWKTANLSYIMPTHRLTVYLMGVMLGYFLRRGGQNLNFSTLQATFGWILAITAGLLAVFEPYQAAYKEYVYNVNDAAKFNAFAPILWTVFLSWGLLACVNGCGGLLNDFLSWKYFAIFTKISYAVYLTQFPVFFYNVGTQRTAKYFKGFHSLFDIPELAAIFLASIILTLTFDIPFQELKKALELGSTKNAVQKLEKRNEKWEAFEKKENKKPRGRLQTFGTM